MHLQRFVDDLEINLKSNNTGNWLVLRPRRSQIQVLLSLVSSRFRDSVNKSFLPLDTEHAYRSPNLEKTFIINIYNCFEGLNMNFVIPSL